MDKLAKQQQYNKKRRNCSNLPDLINRFHSNISKGPIYICNCDQLWYRQSVNSVEKLKLVKPAITQYLLNKKVWKMLSGFVKLACEKHLKNNGMSPGAQKNGMLIPDNFDLNH